MGSLLERLLVAATVIATPLLAAAATAKKSTRTRAAHPKPKATAVTSRKKTPARPARKSVKPPARPAKPARRGAPVRPKAPEPPPAKPAARRPEPAANQPKPVVPTGRALLLLPENGKYSNPVPQFRWLSVGGATRYEIQLSEHSDFADAQISLVDRTGMDVPKEQPLRAVATFYWRVRGGNEAGWGPWSPASSFQVLEEPPAQ